MVADRKELWDQIMRKLQLIGIVFMSLIVFSSAEGADTPPFLPEYYSPVFNDLVFVKHATENNIEQFVYEAKDRSFALSVEDIKADRPSSKAILDNIIIYLTLMNPLVTPLIMEDDRGVRSSRGRGRSIF